MKRVLLECRDLFFRGKLQEIIRATGAEPTRAEPFDLAVIELGNTNTHDQIRDLVQRGVPVLAFGSHVNATDLRAAKALGARAVPNSEIATALRALL